MKKLLLFAVLSIVMLGCGVNPNKEARIQKLEIEIQQSVDKINKLEGQVKALAEINVQLKTRIVELEK